MIKQTLGKIPRKHSKSAGEQSLSSSSSNSSKRTEGGHKRLSSAVDEAISVPYSVLSIGNGNISEEIFLPDKNLKLNENSVSASYNVNNALPSFKDVPSSEKQLLLIRKGAYEEHKRKRDQATYFARASGVCDFCKWKIY